MKKVLIPSVILILSTLHPAIGDGSLKAFNLRDVRLLDSPFKQAEQVDMQYILEMDVDRLLAPFLREAGLEPKAEYYPNWEGDGKGGGLCGHIGGHYLSALSLMEAVAMNFSASSVRSPKRETGMRMEHLP